MEVRYAVVPGKAIPYRVVRNPNYGGKPLSYKGWKAIELTPARYKNKFFVALRESISKEGLRNPLVVYAIDDGLYLSFGGSRLRVANELKLQVPCLINDVAGAYKHCPLVTPENWQQYFRDIPKFFEFGEDGVDYHYSLERNRRQTYDPAGFDWVEAIADKSFLKENFPWLEEYHGERLNK